MTQPFFEENSATTCRIYHTVSFALFGILLLLSNTLLSQRVEVSQQAIDDLVEEIAQNIVGEVDYSQITDDLYYFIDNPINLNNTSENTLEKLRILNVFQIKSLLNYVEINSGMATLYELQLVEGFDYTTIKKLLPFVTLTESIDKNRWEIKRAMKYGNHTVFGRISSTLEVPKGFIEVPDSIYNENTNHYYIGNRTRIYSRYKFNYKNKLQWGFTAEKDPGEQFLKGNQPNGFDFYSAHLQINDVGIIKTAVIGDYQVQLGQGLIMWSYISAGKSSYVMDIRKRGKGINRYSSTDENAYLRGGGVTIEKDQFSFTAFGSHKNIDANIYRNDTLYSKPYFTSFISTGIHAIPSEIEDKNSIKESLFGGNINWNYNKIKIGLSGVNYYFNYPYKPIYSPANQFKFSGKSNSNISTDVEFRFNSVHLFSEVAMSKNGGTAIIAGALMELNPRVCVSILYRNYSKDYQALYSNAFAEGSHTQNEEGFYMGIELHPVKKWKISGYYDLYKFPWLKLLATAPSKGEDFLTQIDYTPSRTLSMYWRYKYEGKEGNSDNIATGVRKLSMIKKILIRYHIGYTITENWELRNRVEFSKFNKSEITETGYMLYQDIIYRPIKYPLSIVFRYAVFDTKSYNTRIYTYENDVLNAYSVPPLFGKGTRTYIMLQYKLFEKLSFWLRIAQTQYSDRIEIGSGLNQISGNTKTDIKFQVRYKF